MRVYVVFHNDIEDSKYVRAVFATVEAAKAHRIVTDPCTSHGWSEHEGKDFPHLERATWGGGDPSKPTDAEHCYSAFPHRTWCCDVQAWEVGE